MIASQESDVVTNQTSILEYMQEAIDQELAVIISSTRTDVYKEYKTVFVNIDNQNNTIILKQLIPEDWQSFINHEERVEIRCLFQNGSISFFGELTVLEEDNEKIFCQIPIPTQLNKNQLRSFFRVSLAEHNTSVSVPTQSGSILKGICQNISLAGCLFQLNTYKNSISKGDLVDQCELIIPGMADLKFSAKVCFVQQTLPHTKLVGIKFLDLKLYQLNVIRNAIDKVEKLRIRKNTPIMFH